MMAFQGERVPGVLDLEMVESMAQDEIPEQDISAQDEFPQPNPEPEIGAAAEAAGYDTPPPSPPPSNSLPGPQRNRDRPRRFGFIRVD